jgi:probable HAF family extracellular repeat protein
MRTKGLTIFFILIGLGIFVSESYGCANKNPFAVLEAEPLHLLVNETVTLDGSCSYDLDGIITKYQWDWTDDISYDYNETSSYYPDGAFDGITTHVYDTNGVYTPRLRVTDNDNAAGEGTCTVYVYEAKTYYVDPGGNDDNNGLSWGTAFATIQKGLNDANYFCIVEVNEGTYNGAIDFTGVFCTVRSTDPNNWDVVANTIINANNSDANVVTFDSGEDANTILRGFTITGGYRGIYCDGASPVISNCVIKDNNSSGGNGGGMYDCNFSYPAVTNCFFVENDANNGGGIYNFDSSPTLTNCVFGKNTANYDGAGMYNQDCRPVLVNCTFAKNQSISGKGGGICNAESAVLMTDCIVWDNSASLADSIYYYDVNFPIVQNLVSWWRFDENDGNTAYDSASGNDGNVYGALWATGQFDSALSFDGTNDYVNVPDDDALDITGDITISAWVYLARGGMPEQVIVAKTLGAGPTNNPYDFRTNPSAEPELRLVRADANGHEVVGSTEGVSLNQWHHVAVKVDNRVPDFYIDGVVATKTGTFTKDPTGNSQPLRIGRRDSGLYLGGKIDDVRLYNRALSDAEIMALTSCVRYCNIEGCGGSGPNNWDPNFGFDNGGNIDSGPFFADVGDPNGADGIFGTSDDGLRLLSNSLCIDAADGNAAGSTDITGQGRVDVNYVDNTGTGEPNYVDMGAYESVFVADNDGDGMRNDWELSYGFDANNFADADTDFDGDGNNNLSEYLHGSEPNDSNSRPLYNIIISVPNDVNNVHRAVNAAINGDTIVLAPGTYQGYWEDSTWRYPIDPDGKNIIFTSENPDDPNIVASTIIYGISPKKGSGWKTYRSCCYFGNGEDSNSALIGLTVLTGCKDGDWSDCQGGFGNGAIYCDGASPTIRKCRLIGGNDKKDGVAVYCKSSYSLIEDCTITGSNLYNYTGIIYVDVDSNITIKGCNISNNNASFGNHCIIYSSGTATIDNCIISGNNGPGVYGAGSYIEVKNSAITDNKSAGQDGAGIYLYYCSGTVINCIITGNQTTTDKNGGGIYVYGSGNITISNCSICKNMADGYGGGIYNFNSDPNVTNCIFWGNQAGGDGNEVYNIVGGKDPNFRYCDINDSGGSGDGWDANLGTDGGGNIDADPCFVDIDDPNGPDNIFGTQDDGLQLQVGSPCIDAADGNAALTTDILGRGRIDVNEVANTGTGKPNYVDIGAYEYRYPSPGPASNPSPADQEPNVSIYADLSWSPGAYTISHDVYLGTDFNDVNDADDPYTPPGRGNQGPNSFDPGTMGSNTMYYWRIDERDANDYMNRGQIWQFKTYPVPGKAYNPDPNGTTGEAIDAILGWSAGEFTDFHDVYFGTSPGDLQLLCRLAVEVNSHDTRRICAFLFSDSQMTDIGSLGRSYEGGPSFTTWAEAFGINRSGRIVGQSYDPNGKPHAFINIPSQGSDPNNWTSPLTDLHTISGADESIAYDISDSNCIVGRADANAFYLTDPNDPNMIQLPGLYSETDPNSVAHSISSGTGQVPAVAVGWSGGHAAYWDNLDTNEPNVHDLGTQWSYCYSRAYKVNEYRQVAGYYWSIFEDEPNYRAFVGDIDTGFTDIGTLSQGNLSRALGLNNTGQIIGEATIDSNDKQLRAFIYEDCQMHNLNDLLDINDVNQSEWVIISARSINDDGFITGYGVIGDPNDPNNRIRAVLLIPARPIGHWEFDQTSGTVAADTSVRGNHGQVNGAAWTSGKVRGALGFDGSNDYVDVPDDASLRFSQYDSFSIAFWAKPASSGRIVCKMRSSNCGGGIFGYEAFWDGAKSAFGFSVEKSCTAFVEVFTPDSSAPADSWYHVAAVYDKKDMRIYLNGELKDSSTFNYDTGSTSPDKNMAIGARSLDSIIEDYFGGEIDDVRIYPYALNQAEITKLFEGEM